MRHEGNRLSSVDPGSLVDSLHQPAVLLDESRRILAANAAVCALLGSLEGRTVDAVAWPTPWDSLPRLLDAASPPADGPVRLVPLGTARLVLLAPLPAQEDTELRGLLRTRCVHDLVARVASGAAHEINNPLGGIVQSVQLIQRALDLESPRTRERLDEAGITESNLEVIGLYLENRRMGKFAGIIQEAGGRVTDLIAHVLGFVRLGEPGLQRHSLAVLLEQALFLASVDTDMRKHYHFRDIALVRPSGLETVEVDAEAPALVFVLVASLKSAARNCAARREREGEGYHPVITIELDQDGDAKGLRIHANGLALSPEVLAACALPPEQARHSPEGLVLSVCREMMTTSNQGGYSVSSDDDGTHISISFKPL